MASSEKLKKNIVSLVNYMLSKKYVSKPLPKIRLISKKQKGDPTLIKTANYNSAIDKINLFIAERHEKDILRSLAHELIHVQQEHENRLEISGSKADDLVDNDELREIEGEAYKLGNLAFREWTEQQKGK